MKAKANICLKNDELQEALMYVDDILNRALMPYIVIGELGKCLFNNTDLSGSKIQIAVKQKELTEYGLSTLKDWIKGLKETEHGFEFEYTTQLLSVNKTVPVEIRVLRKNFFFFNNPDFRFNYNSEFLIPNPFERYWKSRSFI